MDDILKLRISKLETRLEERELECAELFPVIGSMMAGTVQRIHAARRLDAILEECFSIRTELSTLRFDDIA
jgi:hypothetical protein